MSFSWSWKSWALLFWILGSSISLPGFPEFPSLFLLHSSQKPPVASSSLAPTNLESMGRLLFLLYHTKWLFLLFQLFVSFEIQIISFIIILGTHVLWLVFITKAQWTFCGLLSAFVVLGPFKCNHKNISHHWGKVKHSSYLQYNFNESKACFGDISALLPQVYFCYTAPSVSLHLFSLYIVHNLLWLNFSSQFCKVKVFWVDIVDCWTCHSSW